MEYKCFLGHFIACSCNVGVCLLKMVNVVDTRKRIDEETRDDTVKLLTTDLLRIQMSLYTTDEECMECKICTSVVKVTRPDHYVMM